MEKIKLTVQELQWVVEGDSDDFGIIEKKVVGTWRHGNENEAIIQRNSDNKFFKISWKDSSNDMNSFDDMNYGGEYNEVFPKEKIITIYE
jgi:hypothetical protein